MSRSTEQLRLLTLEEKAALLEGVRSWETNAVRRLGIPGLFMTDGPHGLRKVRRDNGGFGLSDNEHSSAFPTAGMVACGWNPDNARRIGEAIARECLAAGVNLLLAPGVNIKRSPLCGRNFEYYSEDPLLSGRMGAAFVRGAQEAGVGCCVKHFAANSNENYRFYGDSVVDERALREIYLRAFERIVKEARPYAVMSAYNRINGVPCVQNRALLTGLLRDEWGFDGIVMTDWGGAMDRLKDIPAGCDLDMPGGVRHNRKAIVEGVKNGSLSVAGVDASVGRMLELVEKCGAQRAAPADAEAHAAVAREVALDCAVLLKNDGCLPLTGREKLLVVGELFEKMRFQGAGSSLINPPSVVTPKAALDRRRVEYVYHRGYDATVGKRSEALEADALAAAAQADTVLFFGGLTDFEECEGFDRPDMKLAENQLSLIAALADTGKKIVLVLYGGAPVELPFFDRLQAMLYMLLPGMEGGEATAALLYGEACPSGKLAESWPLHARDASCAADFDQSAVSRYYESIYTGYRFYDKAGTPLRFPFGYGLSYTSFAYGAMAVREENGAVTVSAEVTNTGARLGAEVVQLYVTNAPGEVFKAEKELRAFAKVALAAGETKTVALSFPKSELAYWNVRRHAWVLENGVYAVGLGASSRDIRLSADLPVADEAEVPCPYPEDVRADYASPPKTVPQGFPALLGYPPPAEPPRMPVTLSSPLRDLKGSFLGRILYAAVLGTVERDYRRARRMPPSLERDAALKNSFFTVRLMPSLSIRAMAMSSDGKLSYSQARGFVQLANGHLFRGIRFMLRRD